MLSSVIYVECQMYFSKYTHYSNWIISNTSLTKMSAFEHRTKWILYQELPAHFRQKPKHAAKREKALTEIEERRVNYSSITYSVIMVGFLKLSKVITKYSMNYTRQCKYYITCRLPKTPNYKMPTETDFTYTPWLNLWYTKKHNKNHICGC